MDWRESLIMSGEPDYIKVPIWKQECMEALAGNKPYFVGGKQIPGGTMGSWAVQFTRSGEYAITLRKLPSAAPEEWNALKEGEAYIICGKIRESKMIREGATSVTFEFHLEKGPADLECWFAGQRMDGEHSGAYFVEVKYID